jgi:uncharacterized protein with FMN-binding domain
MRRALPALIATVSGLVLLVNFHTPAGVKRLTVAVPTTVTTLAAGSSPPPSGANPTTTSVAGTGTGVRQIDGPVVQNPYGSVQVRVILTNGKITDVQPLQMPSDRQYSQEISQQAAPLLHDEVLQAQSAQINLLSGATYTSDAYQQSLQGALDQIKK